jgi:hypothetical protein
MREKRDPVSCLQRMFTVRENLQAREIERRESRRTILQTVSATGKLETGRDGKIFVVAFE